MAGPSLRRLLFANFLVALAALLVFKSALFVYTASGAEGSTSPLRLVGTFFICLGWDVIGALVVTALVAGPVALFLGGGFPRGAVVASALFQAVHGIFLALNDRLWRVMGAPLDKAAIDLAAFSAESPDGGGHPLTLASSVAMYLDRGLIIEVVCAAIMPALAFGLLIPRAPRLARFRGRFAAGLAAAFLMTAVAVPLLVQSRLWVLHTYGLDRSALPVLVASYARGPLRSVLGQEPPPADPFCFDQTVPGDPTPALDNPLRAAHPRKTNVLLVLLESIGAPGLQRTPSPMPFFESLGRQAEGVRFTEHYSHWPQTMHSLFSILCSEMPYPEYTPITYVNPAIPCVSLTEALKGAGYTTAFYTSGDLAFDRQLRFYKHRQFDRIVERGDLPGHEKAWANTWGIDERVTVAAMLSWMDGLDRRRPFFLAYNMIAGHHPYEIPGRPATYGLDSAAEAEALLATQGYIDEQLRALVDGLRARGILEDTLIAILSDHGPGSGRPGMGRVRDASLYEGSVHVPLVLRGPQLASLEGAVAFPTGHLDVAPTLLGLVGVRVPATMKGRDLTARSDARAVLMGTRAPLDQVGVRAGDWKLVFSPHAGTSELFDVAHDAQEQTDRAAERPDLTTALEAQARQWPVHARNLIENYAAILRSNSGRQCGQPSSTVLK